MQSHDLSLPAWGPYTKRYSGISHVPAANDGVRFDLSVFPGMYRRRVDVPNVRFESGFHPWAAAPDLSCYTLRHELLWKDQLYADISFAPLGEDARLIRAELHNNTDAPQNLVLHAMASAWDPVPSYRGFSLPGCEVSLPENAAFVWAKDYDTLHWHGVRLFRRQRTFWAGRAQRKRGHRYLYAFPYRAPACPLSLCTVLESGR